ncbi:hypothetical protein Pmar_PMAR017438, partial [Perkinsus marinus ATCC 50983]
IWTSQNQCEAIPSSNILSWTVDGLSLTTRNLYLRWSGRSRGVHSGSLVKALCLGST